MSHNATTTPRTPGNVSPAISDKGLLRGSIGLAIISLVGFGLLYPLAGVGLGQALFPSTANGSLIEPRWQGPRLLTGGAAVLG